MNVENSLPFVKNMDYQAILKDLVHEMADMCGCFLKNHILLSEAERYF